MSFRACPLLANGFPRFQLGLALTFKSRDMAICRGPIPPMGMSLYCFNRWCRKHVRDSHGPFPTIAQTEPAGTLPEPRLRCLRADFHCGASAAGSRCGCKKTPYLGQIARNLSFAAAWIASRGHGKNALFRQNKLFFGGPLSEIKESVGGDMSFRACPLLANGFPRFQLGLELTFKSRDMAICRGSIPPMGMSLYCFNRWCRKHVRDSHGPFPTIAQTEPAGTLPQPRLRCLRADFHCGASAAGSCCGCKKTPYLGQIARNLGFAAAWIASRGHGK